MENIIVRQFLALSVYLFLVGFCFCDGFKLHIVRKLIWFGTFLTISIYVLYTKGEFDLSYILPFPSLLAIFLCSYDKIKQNRF